MISIIAAIKENNALTITAFLKNTLNLLATAFVTEVPSPLIESSTNIFKTKKITYNFLDHQYLKNAPGGHLKKSRPGKQLPG